MSKKFDLEAYKKTIKSADTPLKKDKFVELDHCLQEVLGLPGIPLGHISMIFGKSDVGKTSLLWHIAAQAQKQDILPICCISEGKVDWNRAEAMGVDRNKAIVNENCEYLEDVFAFMDKIINDVSNGDLPQDIIILFDSVGNTLSKDEVKVNQDGTIEKRGSNMKAAKCISENMRILSKRVNDTRKISYPKSVGLVIINQAYTSPSTIPGIPPSLTPYGGTAIYYRSSLVVRMNRKSRLKATKAGKNISFGIVANITVDKNHISSLSQSGSFIITADRFIPNLKSVIDAYKKEKSSEWGEALELVAEKEEIDVEE